MLCTYGILYLIIYVQISSDIRAISSETPKHRKILFTVKCDSILNQTPLNNPPNQIQIKSN